MSTISLEKFKKLSDKEKCNRYKDLSDYDKYVFRVTDPNPFLHAETIRYMEITKKQKKEAHARIKRVQEKVNKKLK